MPDKYKLMLKSFLQWLVLFYVLLILFLYFFADRAIFVPRRATYSDNENIIKIQSGNNNKISAYYLHNRRAKYTFLVSHGNNEDIGKMTSFAKQFVKHGYSVVMYDYQGYGTSEGNPTVENSKADIQAVANYMQQKLKLKTKNIILYGRSVGSGPTLNLAQHHDFAGVVLESPFLTAFTVVTQIPILPFDKYYNNKIIQKLHTPIFIIQGSKDRVIPNSHGKKLYQLANQPKMYWLVENAGHNNLVKIGGDEFWRKIALFISHYIK